MPALKQIRTSPLHLLRLTCSRRAALPFDKCLEMFWENFSVKNIPKNGPLSRVSLRRGNQKEASGKY
uniref:Uncharacterized protein n=1 Tax=Anguilla anguilla TaxID=7936 RepID=A0A0E9SB23_ANGAN